jgi:putative transcriptional regulator
LFTKSGIIVRIQPAAGIGGRKDQGLPELNYDRTVRQIPEGRPVDALLAAYAAKTLTQPQAALVAAHLELRPDNRGYVAALEAVHGVFLEELKPVPLAGRDRRLVNIFSSPTVEPLPETSEQPVADGNDLLPRALRRLAGCDFVDPPWRHRASGIKEALLPDDGAGCARFVSVAPGVRLPIARDDAALVLAGAASNGAGYYERGGIVFAGEPTSGGPTVEGSVDCVCFVVTEAPVKLPGRLSRVLHLVMGA